MFISPILFSFARRLAGYAFLCSLLLGAAALPAQADPALPAAEAKAQAVFLPSITLQNATLREAVDFLRRKGGVDIVLQMPAGPEPSLTMDLRNIPLYEALRYVADLANLQLTADEHALKLAPGQAKPLPSAGPSLALAKAKKIIFPRIELQEASTEEALGFLRQKARSLDPEKTGVNIVLKPTPASSQAHITLSLTNVPLDQALRYVAELSGLQVTAGLVGLTVGPGEVPKAALGPASPK